MVAAEEFSDSHFNSLLSQHFGYTTFRPLQLDAIKTVLSGKDCLLILPTGGGKSLTFQLPAAASKKISVVITPLLALARDQVENANDSGIEAASWSSQTSEKQKATLSREIVAEDGDLRLVYTTPESLQTERLLDILTTAHASGRLCMLAVDEAHAVSEWGHDFRPSYLTLRDFRSKFPGLPCLAVTATATPRVRSSIINYLNLSSPNILLGSFNRPNLQFSVMYKELLVQKQQEQMKEKKPTLKACAAAVPTPAPTEDDDNEEDKEDSDDDKNSMNSSDPIIAEVIRFIKQRPGQSGIIYCRLRSTCDLVASALCCADIDAASYHAGLDPERRSKVQNDWKNDGYAVVVATIAFGMGIDKSDVRFVLHIDPPASLEGLYQEAGRGGRDGQPAVSMVFASHEDLKKAQKMEKGGRAGSTAAVAGYVHHTGCRRQALLAHFSEKLGPCSANNREELCDYCKSPGAVASQLAKVEEICRAAAADRDRGANRVGHLRGEEKVEKKDPYDRVDPGSGDEDDEERGRVNKEEKEEEKTDVGQKVRSALPTKRKPLARSLKPLKFVQYASKENEDKGVDPLQKQKEENAAVEVAVARKRRQVFIAPRCMEH